jgi:nucleoside-diphosphate-sugar epimerase
MPDKPKQTLILGGAGFIGSHIAALLSSCGHRVTVIDGLMPQTGGNLDNLKPLLSRICFIQSRVEEVSELESLIANSNTVVDCMGWTCHMLAIEDPLYDAELNLQSHLKVLQSALRAASTRFIYLGSRGQYGRPTRALIAEDCPMEPVDIQGIHKLAAECYYRFFASRCNLPVVSLRLPNCIGPHQLVRGKDVGLFGGFVRDMVNGRTVTVYGSGRKRSVVYVKDVAEIVQRVAESRFMRFDAYNLPGHLVELDAAASKMAEYAGSSDVRSAHLPPEIAAIDTGDAEADCTKLGSLIGPFELTPLNEMLRATVNYFREALQ